MGTPGLLLSVSCVWVKECVNGARGRASGLRTQRSRGWEGAPFLFVKEMAKIIIARSRTNSLLKSAMSCSNFPVGGLRKEKRI